MSSPINLPILYVQDGCHRCREVVDFLSNNGVNFREIDLSEHPEAEAEVQRISDQSKVPTLDWNGKILADFGIDELVPFLRDRHVRLEDS